MKGIVLASHGEFAKGLADSATFFMGDDIEQLEYCCLCQDSSLEEFTARLKAAMARVDSGDGVVVLADLLGGSPCNQAIAQLREQVDLIAGMNFPVLLELLSARMGGEVDMESLIARGRTGLCDVRPILTSQGVDEDDEV